MATCKGWSSSQNKTVVDPSSSKVRLDSFFQCVAAAGESVLLLDFDGTLAPFRVDPRKVRPWAGIASLLNEIQQTDRTRMVIITGRPAGDVASQIGMRNAPEIWGLHGAERLYSDGRLEEEELASEVEAALGFAQSTIVETCTALRVEEKRNAVVVHWRGRPMRSMRGLRDHALKLLLPFASVPGIKLLEFDGGLELRGGRNKGDAVRLILDEIPTSAPVAYLGDDATDEDAFRALADRGLGVLVRREWRPGEAQIWLRPPAQLRGFLIDWLRATKR